MKKLQVLAFLVVTSFYCRAQTAEEILDKLATGLGGSENLNAINTLQYNTNLKLSAMGFPLEISITQTKEKNKLSRTDVGGIMGMPGSYTICTDTAVYVSTPNIPAMGEFGGMPGGIKKMDAEAVKTAKSQLSCNGYFVNLFNYKANGGSLEFLGKEKYNKVECYKLKVTDASGEIMVYFINSTTNLIDKCEAAASAAMAALTGGIGGGMGPMAMIGGGEMKNTKVTIVYSDYVTVGNVKFPTKETIQIGANDIEMAHSNFVVNDPVNPKLYIAN